jgi:methyl-accepting chemotaxis protein
MLVITVVFMAGFGLMKVKGANLSINSLYDDRIVPLKQLKVVADMYAVNIVDNTNKVAAGMAEPKIALANVQEAEKTVAAEWKAYLATDLTPNEKKLADQATGLMAKAAPAVASLRSALESGDREKIATQIKPIYETVDPLSDVISKLVDVQLDEAKVEHDRAAADYATTITLFSVVVLAAVALGIAISWVLINAITQPLNQAVKVARNVAGGDLTQLIRGEGRNETATLLNALK